MVVAFFLTIIGLSLLVQIVYWWGLFGRLLFHQNSSGLQPANQDFPALSIVICARNEAENLRRNLPLVLQQDYPVFEVLVVDDVSTDGTSEVLEELARQYPRLRVLSLAEKTTPGKKGALECGIRLAKHDWLLLTDADCVPAGAQWAREMALRTHENTSVEIVLGFGAYAKRDGFLNALIQYETFLTAVQYFSYAIVGTPYMGVGRNVMYHRRIFDRVGGFEAHQHLASGDDDMLIQAAATSHNTTIATSAASFTVSQPPVTWRAWYRQKRRHLSTGTHYKPHHIVLLGLFSVSHYMIYAGLLMCLLAKLSLAFAVGVIVFRYVTIFPAVYLLSRRLSTQVPIRWLPLLDATLPMFYFLMTHVFFLNSHRWK